jgi:hypothetical protein
MALRLESSEKETRTQAQEFLHRLVRVLENPASLESRIHYFDAFDALKTAPEQDRNEFIKRLAPLAEAASRGAHTNTAENAARTALRQWSADAWRGPAFFTGKPAA